jgi:hypothetical protein
MKTFKTLTVCIMLSTIILCTCAFANEKKEKSKKGLNQYEYEWTPPATTTSCTKLCKARCGNNKTICCPGGSVVIGGSGNDCQDNAPDPDCPSTQVSFSWSPSTGLSSTTVCNPTASPNSTTTYTLTVTFTCNGDCCCDGCSGNCGTSPQCTGTETRNCSVTVTVNNTCCRAVNPEKLPEVNKADAKVYPNPSPGSFTLEVQSVQTNAYNKAHVYDSNGKAVWFKEITEPGSLNIDLTEFGKGIYFIDIKSNEEVIFFKKLLVQ